jgi:hypothetical protein
MRIVALVALFGLTACGEKERTLDVRWELPAEPGPCGAPGYEQLKGEKRVVVRYVGAPAYFEEFCSTKLADALTARARPIEPMQVIASRNGHAVCGLAGLTGRRLNQGCSFENATLAGVQGSNPGPPPWQD